MYKEETCVYITSKEIPDDQTQAQIFKYIGIDLRYDCFHKDN